MIRGTNRGIASRSETHTGSRGEGRSSGAAARRKLAGETVAGREGGRDIRPLADDHARFSASYYFQERIIGPSFSALYMGRRDGTRLLGVTQQLLGVPGNSFGYRGSIGPWPIEDSLARKIHELGEVVASASGLVGWFGIDYVLRDGEPWPVEVNPRYTASVEVHELTCPTRRALVGEHRLACEGGVVPAPAPDAASSHCVVAKLVIHAPFEVDGP